jgi:hypothetical protein
MMVTTTKEGLAIYNAITENIMQNCPKYDFYMALDSIVNGLHEACERCATAERYAVELEEKLKMVQK